MADMRNGMRSTHAAVACGGLLYVLGGDGASKKSVERFDPEANTWEDVSPMSSSRPLLSAAVVGGKIYAVGGAQAGSAQTCERFDPITNAWEPVPDTPIAHGTRPGVAEMHGKLWVTGGDRIVNVDVFDPESNTWSSKADMIHGRCHHALAVLNGELRAVGGWDVASSEKYDARTDSWSVAPEMYLTTGMRGACHAAVLMI